MQIEGKEYNFTYTVRASLAIARDLPGHNLSNIVEVLQKGDQVKTVDLISLMAVEMNKAYLMKQAYEINEKFNPDDVLKKDSILSLDYDGFSQLQNELLDAMIGDSKTELDTEIAKKKEENEK